MSSRSFLDRCVASLTFPASPDQLIELFSPMAIDRVVSSIPSREVRESCQAKLTLLRSDEPLTVTYNELAAIKPPHILLFEGIVQRSLLQPFPWIYLRGLSVTHPDVLPLVEARVRKLQDAEQNTVSLLYCSLSGSRSFSVWSWKSAKELKIFLISHTACFWKNGKLSWEDLIEIWSKLETSPREALECKNALFDQLAPISFFEESSVDIQMTQPFSDTFKEFVGRFSLSKIFKENLGILCEQSIHKELLESFTRMEKDRQFALYYTAQLASGTLCSKDVPECTLLLRKLFEAAEILLFLKKPTVQCDWNALFAALFRSAPLGRALFHAHRETLEPSTFCEAFTAKIVPCSREDELSTAVRIARFAPIAEVKNLVQCIGDAAMLMHTIDLASEMLEEPLGIPKFCDLFQEQTELARGQFTTLDPKKRVALCMNMVAHSVERQEREFFKMEHEGAFIDAGLCYALKPDFAVAVIQTMETLLRKRLSPEEQVYLLARAQSSSLETLPVDPPTNYGERFRKYGFNTHQLLLLHFWTLEGHSIAEGSILSIQEHFDFIERLEQLIECDLAPEIVLGCLLCHNLPRPFLRYLERFKALQKTIADLSTEIPFATREEITEMCLEMAKSQPYVPLQFYLPVDAGFCAAITNLLRLAVCTVKVQHEKSSFRPQPFFPSAIKLQTTSQFSLLVPSCLSQSKATISAWEKHEEGMLFHLEVLHSLSHLKSRSIRKLLRFSQQELDSDPDLAFIVHAIIRIFSQERPLGADHHVQASNDLEECKAEITARLPWLENCDDLPFVPKWEAYIQKVGEDRAWEVASRAYSFVRDLARGLQKLIPLLSMRPTSQAEDLESGTVYEIEGGLSLVPRNDERYSLLFSDYLPLFSQACTSLQEELEHTFPTKMKLHDEVDVTISLTRNGQNVTQTVLVQDPQLSHTIALSTTLKPEAQAKLLFWQMMLLKSRFFRQ